MSQRIIRIETTHPGFHLQHIFEPIHFPDTLTAAVGGIDAKSDHHPEQPKSLAVGNCLDHLRLRSRLRRISSAKKGSIPELNDEDTQPQIDQIYQIEKRTRQSQFVSWFITQSGESGKSAVPTILSFHGGVDGLAKAIHHVALTSGNMADVTGRWWKMLSFCASLSRYCDFYAFVWTLVLLPFSDCSTKKVGVVYERDDANRYLRIERLPESSGTAFSNYEIETAHGKKRVRDVQGTLDSLLSECTNGWRIVVDSKDSSNYRVLCDDLDLVIAHEIADALNLQIAPGRRRRLAYRLVCNNEAPIGLELSRGQPKWPALRPARPEDQNAHNWFLMERAKFAHGGIYNGYGDDIEYCDDITFDELALYLEQAFQLPFVNETNLVGRYHFKIPEQLHRHITFTDPFPLPSLGVSIIASHIDIDVLVVSDSAPSCGATSPPDLSSLLFNSFQSAAAIQQKN